MIHDDSNNDNHINSAHQKEITTTMIVPVVVRDARFRAGRTLVMTGLGDQAVDVFATLLQEARRQYGDDHVEAAPAYYEYGNAVFRAALAAKYNRDDAAAAATDGAKGGENSSQKEQEKKPQQPLSAREAAAAAAERRAKQQQQQALDPHSSSATKTTNDCKMEETSEKVPIKDEMAAAVDKNEYNDTERKYATDENHGEKTSIKIETAIKEDGKCAASDPIDTKVKEEEEEQNEKGNASNSAKNELQDTPANVNSNEVNDDGDDGEVESSVQEGDDQEEDEVDDFHLALEMMETAWSILDKYVTEQGAPTRDHNHARTSGSSNYFPWATEQLPRCLTGIGEVLSALERHADAADAYSRAVGYRQDFLQQQLKQQEQNDVLSVELLTCRRRIVEGNVLIAEAFLACPGDQDVITTETQTLLVKAPERIEYARGYYENAREELQETLVLMGQMVAKGVPGLHEEDKEDLCHASTMVMYLGETLAALDEEEAEQAAAARKSQQEPLKKKAKTK